MANPEDKVVVGYCSPGTVHLAFHESLLGLMVYDAQTAGRIIGGGGRIAVQSSANIASSRNTIVKQFLDESEADWLWMVDTDMTFAPDTLEALLDLADPDLAPIVGGLCFGIDDGWLFPTLYNIRPDEEPPVVRYHTFPPNAMFQIAATGAACLLVHRTVLAKVREQSGDQFSVAFPWFQEREHGTMRISEDVTFCLRAGLCGFPIYVNTGVTIGHVKQHTLTLDGYLGQRAFMAAQQQQAEVAA